MIYIDMNTDVDNEKYKKFKEFIEIQGWKCHESISWTRKGWDNQKNSNIDIIVTYAI